MKVFKYLAYDENRSNKVYGHTLSLSTGIRVTENGKGKSLFIPFSFFAEEPISDAAVKGGKISDLRIAESSEVDRVTLLAALRDAKLTSAKYNKVLKAAVHNIYIEVTFADLKVEGAKLDLKGLVKNIHADWQEGEADYEANTESESIMMRNILLVYLGKEVITSGKVTLFTNKKR